MSHVSNLELCSNMWAKFELLYRDTEFMELDTILIQLSSRTAFDFDFVIHFADSLNRNFTRLKKIGTKDVPDWMFTIWLLNGLTSEYDSFRKIFFFLKSIKATSSASKADMRAGNIQ